MNFPSIVSLRYAKRHASPRVLLATAVVGSLLFAAGCTGKSGRIGTMGTTEAEARDRRVVPVVLFEFSDAVPRRLAQDLANLPVLGASQGPATVTLGDINNKTQIVSTDEFELMARRIRSSLINATPAGDKLVFVENRSRVQSLAQREQVASSQGVPAGPDNYDPQNTYALNADVYSIARDNTVVYYMEVQLVHFASNQIVFSDNYASKQVAYSH